MGLDRDFTMIKTQILEKKTILTDYHMVAEDERQRIISNKHQATFESAAFKAFQK
jgi:hypothetical protein